MNKKLDKSEITKMSDLSENELHEDPDQLIRNKINQREEENKALKKILENLNNQPIITKKKS